MNDILPYVIGLHTVLLLVLGLMVFGLARQIGILHERVAPMGAMVNDHGPEVGEMAPSMSVASLQGGMVQIGGPAASGRSRLLMFVSPTCPVCRSCCPSPGPLPGASGWRSPWWAMATSASSAA